MFYVLIPAFRSIFLCVNTCFLMYIVVCIFMFMYVYLLLFFLISMLLYTNTCFHVSILLCIMLTIGCVFLFTPMVIFQSEFYMYQYLFIYLYYTPIVVCSRYFCVYHYIFSGFYSFMQQYLFLRSVFLNELVEIF